MTLAKVAHGVSPDPLELLEIDNGVNAFLGDHITGLREMAVKRKTPPGRFTDHEAQHLFADLFAGADVSFLAAAGTLTKRLIARMDRRTSPGLLVCLRALDNQERYGGVLKLQVVAPNAAVLEQLAAGKVKLSAVQDLLDKPGDLQKGAISTSWLRDDRILVGDQLNHEAAYFPAAFGIMIFGRPATAVAELLTAIDAIKPELAESVARALPAVRSGEPEDVLAGLAQSVAELTDSVQADILETLAQRPRPVGYIDTSRPATETIKAGQISITGPVADMRRYVRISRRPDEEAWTVVVAAEDKPRRSHP